MTWAAEDNFREAIKQIGVDAEELDAKAAETNRQGILHKYSIKSQGLYNFYDFSDAALAMPSDFSNDDQITVVKKFFEKYLSNKEIVVFFDDIETKIVFRFKDALDLIKVIPELAVYNIYVGDPAGDFILCFTKYDNLLALGKAKEWMDIFLHEEKDVGDH